MGYVSSRANVTGAESLVCYRGKPHRDLLATVSCSRYLLTHIMGGSKLRTEIPETKFRIFCPMPQFLNPSLCHSRRRETDDLSTTPVDFTDRTSEIRVLKHGVK